MRCQLQAASTWAGGTLPMDSINREWLNQSTHVGVASSTASGSITGAAIRASWAVAARTTARCMPSCVVFS